MADELRVGRGRKAVVAVIAGGISLGSLACIALDADLWPWSNYPMYREVQGKKLRYRSAVAVLQDGSEAPFSHEQARPYSAARMNRVLRRLGRRGDSVRATALMERLTRQARERGPTDRIVGARAYDLHWTLRPGAVNRDRPDRRDLLAEYLLPGWSRLASTQPIRLTPPERAGEAAEGQEP